MKRFRSSLSLLVFLAACSPGGSHSDPTGHWEGNITLPGMTLAIQVDLEKMGAEGWTGTIDIPAQGVRNLKLTATTVHEDTVAFGMAGIPGDPKFAGKQQGKTISGNFAQNGQTFPFKLERKPKPAAAAVAETPKKGVPGKGLAGFWQGSLKPMPGMELRLVLEITGSADGSLAGVLVSLDQGNARIPMTELTLKKNLVHFETKSIGGVFDGDISDDGSDLDGEWQQLGRETPVTFVRLAEAPKKGMP